MLLTDAIDYVNQKKRKGVHCPCCKQFVKIYKRKLNSGMARMLVVCYQPFSSNPGKYLDVVNYCAKKHSFVSGDHGKLLAWGLLEKKPGVYKGTKSGLYRLTSTGKAFVERRMSVPKYCYFFNGEAIDFSDEVTDVVESLGNHFSYDELMQA